jgi:hypothetical protein
VTVSPLWRRRCPQQDGNEKPGREYLKRLKEAVRPAEAEIKRFVDACDELRDATRRPLTEWEAEQERIKAEEAMNAMHAEALEMNEEFDRQRRAVRSGPRNGSADE